MAVYDNLQKSYSAGVKPTLVESYLQRNALKNVEPRLGYLQDAQKIKQPMHNGKHVTFWRYSELTAVTDPLIEGVTPDAESLTATAFTVMTKPYGRHMEYTDEFNLFFVDDKVQAMSERLNRQAELSIDTVGRDAICAGLNVMYPGSVTSRAGLTASDVLGYATIKKAVRNLKRKGAQPFPDGFFHSKISHETYYDLTNDPKWTDIATYQNKAAIERYEVGCIFDVKFFTVDNGKVFTNETYLFGTKTDLTASADFDAANRTMIVSDTLSEDDARALTGKMVYVQYTKSLSEYVTPMCIERAYAGEKKIVFRWVPDASTTDEWTTAQSLKVVPSGGASNGDPVHATIIYGQDAFGMVRLGTPKEPNIQIIVKPLGSSGSNDPLNQRGTIAWKVPHFACAVLQDDFIVRIEHGVSA